MNCKGAREIINLLMDGEQHPQADQAHAHVSECASCMEWQSSMDCALSIISAQELPEIDLAPAIMSRLPEHHPASQVRKRWMPGRALAWIGACWAAGLPAVVVIGLQIYHMLTPGWTQVAAIRAFDLTRGFMSMLSYGFSTCTALFGALLRVFEYQGITASGVTSYALGSILLDSILLAIILAIWLKGKRTPGLFIVLG
ncbi:MAG TPA: hypothetical protein VFI02_04590 [Armatimonadota bacterium]|nr:hypothetical protein [Armatimonadota bacterium]